MRVMIHTMVTLHAGLGNIQQYCVGESLMDTNERVYLDEEWMKNRCDWLIHWLGA